MKRGVLLCLFLCSAVMLCAQMGLSEEERGFSLMASAGAGNGLFVAGAAEYGILDYTDFELAPLRVGTTLQAVFVPKTRLDYQALGAGLMASTHYPLEALGPIEIFLSGGFGYIYYTDYDESEVLSRGTIVFATEGGVEYLFSDSMSFYAGLNSYWGEFFGIMGGVRFTLN